MTSDAVRTDEEHDAVEARSGGRDDVLARTVRLKLQLDEGLLAEAAWREDRLRAPGRRRRAARREPERRRSARSGTAPWSVPAGPLVPKSMFATSARKAAPRRRHPPSPPPPPPPHPPRPRKRRSKARAGRRREISSEQPSMAPSQTNLIDPVPCDPLVTGTVCARIVPHRGARFYRGIQHESTDIRPGAPMCPPGSRRGRAKLNRSPDPSRGGTAVGDSAPSTPAALMLRPPGCYMNAGGDPHFRAPAEARDAPAGRPGADSRPGSPAEDARGVRRSEERRPQPQGRDRGRAAPGRAARPHAALGPAGPRQDDARRAHRARAPGELQEHLGARHRARRRPRRASSPDSRRATSCSSTRSTASRRPSRSTSTPRWRTSSSTS